MKSDGYLEWAPPPGEWKVVRMGYSLLGYTNRPDAPQMTGLEADKLNGEDVKAYIDTLLGKYRSLLGPQLGGQVKYMTIDSYEVGAQNWTEGIIAEFSKRRGYDPTPWLPVLTGRVVESPKASDEFLWDFRKTLGELMVDNHYGTMQKEINGHGLKSYVESHESGRVMSPDGMEVKKRADIPMGAMWTQQFGTNPEQYGYDADDKETSSVAHVYGQNLAAAESLTAGLGAWAWSPATLKPTVDKELAEGINRFVIHTSVHQPMVGPGTAPGLGLAQFGQWFNRNETWAEQAKPWVEYMGRSSYMLQQGKYVADVLYYYGEDNNVTFLFRDKLPPVPLQYSFDYINPDGLMHEFDVKDGGITTKAGMSYRVLGLDPYSKNMSLPVLKAIEELVKKGAVIAGPKPTADVSLADDHAEFNRVADELFGDGSGVHSVGAGKVFAGATVAEALSALKVAPDFAHSSPEKEIDFVHRGTAGADVYWVDNRNDAALMVDGTFRIAGKVPELWIPETGETRAVSYTIADGKTTVPLKLDPWGAVFVVFRKAAKEASHQEPVMTETVLATLDGTWPIAFEAGRGAPPSGTLAKLESWTESENVGVKYFSGMGTYTKWVQAPAGWLGKGQVWIDLGDVKNLAEVKVNGVSLGVVWHAPYRVDVTKALKAGANKLEITVTNAWVNRLIGDQQPGAKQYTFTTFKPYTKDSALLPSGLLGPVRMVREEKETR
jgi:alpha-L-rhamnosidase